MPNGMAVTRMTPRYLKPWKVWSKAGSGSEKPKFDTDAASLSTPMPPQPRPAADELQAIADPTPIATRPAGTPLYFTPPNQLARMIAKQTTPITGVVNICAAGRIEMNVIDTPASVPSSAARGVTLRMNGAMKPPPISTKLWTKTHVSPASHPCTGSPVLIAIGSMITNVTMNMCGTLMPD